jgi:hypothetical protein
MFKMVSQMKLSRLPSWIAPVILLSLTPVIAFTQGRECSAVVESALAATNEICEATGRNEACYGHLHLEAQPQDTTLPFDFSEVGDKIDIARLSTLRLSPLDEVNETWGVAMMRVQADIPDTMPDANVSLLIFGDVEIRNAVPDLVTVDLTIAGPATANVRRQPSSRAFVIGSLAAGTTVQARGRSSDGSWLYINLPESEASGWIRTSFLTASREIQSLRIIDPSLVSYGPMQAFFLQNGTNQTICGDTPNDGILIQTPEGVAEIRLWINEVKIRLGSTAFIQARPNEMVVQTLEGAAHVEALGVEQVAVAGTSISIEVNENNQPVAPPSSPQAYDLSEVNDLPVESLDRTITPAPPLVVTPTNTPVPTNTMLPEIVTSPDVTDIPVVIPPTATTVIPSATPIEIVAPTNTDVPSTSVPPTDVPPTSVPPTDVPPTSVPPTDVPPTDPPPTEDPGGGNPTDTPAP